jgi:hypothetical protein
VVKAVVRFRDQLKERGIYLLVAAVPGKPSVYPDRLTRRAKGAAPEIDSPTKRLIEQLDEQGVATVDLHSLFVSSRLSSSGQESSALFLARDTHWTPRGVKLAASETASRLLQLGWVTRDSHPFITTNVAVCRWGDILEMTRIPGIRNQFQPELVWCEQVRDEGLGLLIPAASERPGACRHPASKSSVLVLGDSFSRIYQFPEPQSLGDMPSGQGHAETAQPREQTKRLLPGSAGFVSHLALALGAPVDAIVSDGGASTDVRRKLSTYPEILEGKKVVVWEFVERDIGLGREGWLDVPLPPKLDG